MINIYRTSAKRLGAKVTALGKLVKLVPQKKKKILMYSFIQSQFSYCPLLWMFCSRALNKKINHIHERGLRMVYRDYISSFEELLIKDESVCIHHRNIQLVAVEMFKVKNDFCPEIIKDLFNLNPNPKLEKDFFRPNVNKVYMGESSLRWFGPIVWDSMLPRSFKTIMTLEKFREDIKAWVPEGCPCRLCKVYIRNLGFVTLFE